MGIIARFRRGLRIGLQSFRVLGSSPELLVFPVTSVLTVLIVGGLLFVATIPLDLLGRAVGGTAGQVILLFVTAVSIFVLTTVSTFFNAGLVYAASRALQGEDPTVVGGLKAAAAVIDKILVWGLVSATVSIVLQIIEESDERVGRIVAGILGASWGLLTYFVVPVMVLDDVGPKGMFVESGLTFKRTWGETFVASAGVGLVLGTVTLVAILAAILISTFVLIPLFGGLSAIVVLLLSVFGILAVVVPVGTAVTTIAKTALYLYAETGVEPDAFEGIDFRAVFEASPRRGAPGTFGI